jgi:peptide/nickel transport system permease protein
MSALSAPGDPSGTSTGTTGPGPGTGLGPGTGPATGAEQAAVAVIGRRGGMLRRMPGKAKVGAALLGVFVLVAIIGPAIAPYDPSATIPGQALPTAPSAAHLLGTTNTGQDVLSQLLAGTRSTVVLGLLTGVIATLLSVVIGMSAGFLGGMPDEGLSLLANVFLVLPALPLLVVILGYLPHSGELPTAIVLSALGWPWGARVIRAQTLSLRGRDYVSAARESGESTARIIFFEIFPNEVGLIAASFVGTVLYAILTSVALAFLGVSDLSSWSYGTMLYWAQNANAVQLGAWWWYGPPGVCVALLGMSLVLLNFGLDELGNPRLRAVTPRRISRRSWRPADPTPVIRTEAIRRPNG